MACTSVKDLNSGNKHNLFAVLNFFFFLHYHSKYSYVGA